MKRAFTILMLVAVSTVSFAQMDWRAAFQQAADLRQRADVVRRMDSANVEGALWETVLVALYRQWNNLNNNLDRFVAEEAMRVVLKQHRQQQLTGNGRIVYAIARQATTTHLKAEAILTLGHLNFAPAVEWLADYVWHISQEPSGSALNDEIVASAGVESLRLYRSNQALPALAAASSERSWFPAYIRNSALAGLQELSTLKEL